MKAIQAEYYGCTDLSQVELEQTRGGNPAIWAAIAYAAKKIWDYFSSSTVKGGTPKSTTNQVTQVIGGVTNVTTTVTSSSGYISFEHP